MVLPKFDSLKGLSEKTLTKDSGIVLREFLIASHNFTTSCLFKTEDQVGEITKSLQNWIMRKDFTDYKEKNTQGKLNVAPVNIGEIFIADLGLSYETAYSHPVLIVDNIDNRVLVIPTTSAKSKMDIAYHPTQNSEGNRKYRKVFRSDGFEVESVLMISSATIISKGRLLERKGRLNEDITDPNSIYQEIKNTLFEILFSDKKFVMDTLNEEIIRLKEENRQLQLQMQGN